MKVVAKDFNERLTKGGNMAVNNKIYEIIANSKKDFEKQDREKAEKQAEKQAAELKKAVLEKAAKNKKHLKNLFYLPYTDLGNSDRIFELFGDVIRFNTETQTWGFFNNGVWKFADKNNSALYPHCRQIAEIIKENAPKYSVIQNSDGSITQNENQNQPKDAQEVLNGETLTKMWQKKKTHCNAIEMLKGRSEILVTQNDLDKNPMLLNVKNGFIDLETGKFYPSDPKQLFTKQANVIFNPRATCPAFNKFMQEILPDEQTRAAVLRWLGYCLTGLVNEEKALFVVGTGANGKGTLFDTINFLLNDYATTFNVELILRQRYSVNANAPTAERAKLRGVRFAYAPEIPAGREFDLATFKELTGGDIITARPPYQLPIEFFPTHKFILSGQHFPKVENSHDVGFLRRFLPVIFNQDFSGDKSDAHLKNKLRATDELSGILNILVRECMAWQSEGLMMSGAMQKTRDEYIEENDFIANFIADNCEIGADLSISRKNFVESLKKEYPQARRFSEKKLTEMILKKGGITYKKSNGDRKFFGIGFFDEG